MSKKAKVKQEVDLADADGAAAAVEADPQDADDPVVKEVRVEN